MTIVRIQNFLTLADSANALITFSAFVVFYARVFFIKRVAFWAVRSIAVYVDKSQWTTQLIFSVCGYFNVGRIHAVSDTAEVVGYQIGGRDVNEQGVTQSVSSTACVSSDTKYSVAVLVQTSKPFPARNAVVKVCGRNFNFGKQSGKKFSINRNASKIVIRHLTSKIGKVFRLGSVLSACPRAVFTLTGKLAVE